MNTYKQNITHRLLTLTYALRMLGHSDEANSLIGVARGLQLKEQGI